MLTTLITSEQVVPLLETPLNPDDGAMIALGDLFTAVTASDTRLLEEGQRTRESAQIVFAQMQRYLANLAEENNHLRIALSESEGRQREIERLHQEKVSALEGALAIANESLQATRQQTLQEMNRVQQETNKIQNSAASSMHRHRIEIDKNLKECKAKVAAAHEENKKYEGYRQQLLQVDRALQRAEQSTEKDRVWHRKYGPGGWNPEKQAEYLCQRLASIRQNIKV